jgi:hypothetical protein
MFFLIFPLYIFKINLQLLMVKLYRLDNIEKEICIGTKVANNLDGRGGSWTAMSGKRKVFF